MKTVIPLTVCAALLILLTFMYLVSPLAEVRELRTENSTLKNALLMANSSRESDLVETVIVGFLLCMLLCFVFFFLVLCLLAGKTPVEFFLPSVPGFPSLPETPQPKPEIQIENRPAETPAFNCIPDYPMEYYRGEK